MKQTLSSYKNNHGDVISRSKIGSITVCEIDYNVNDTSREDEKKTVTLHSSNKPTKEMRVNRIKALITEGKTRTECKEVMYKEQFYFGNPNPPSAFAGDWNSIEQ